MWERLWFIYQGYLVFMAAALVHAATGSNLQVASPVATTLRSLGNPMGCCTSIPHIHTLRHAADDKNVTRIYSARECCYRIAQGGPRGCVNFHVTRNGDAAEQIITRRLRL